MEKEDKKVGFDISVLTLDELIKVYDNITSFLQTLEDKTIKIEDKKEGKHE